MHHAKYKQKSCGQFDQRVLDGNSTATVPAFTAQHGPTSERDIVRRANPLAAAATMRGRRENGLARRQPDDADVEKAAQQKSGDNCNGQRYGKNCNHAAAVYAVADESR